MRLQNSCNEILTILRIIKNVKGINMWLKKLFDFNEISPKVNDQPIQNDTQEKPTKNKWLNPKENFGKLERSTD